MHRIRPSVIFIKPAFMIAIRLFCFCLLISTGLQSQDFKLDSVVVLQSTLPESSGLLYRDGVLITHNDSGDGPYLYEIDTLTGAVARTVCLANASAVDWEELAADETYLYIGDFGNNLGARTDLRIYRVAWDDYWQQDTVLAEAIHFNYAEQTDFSIQTETTPFDAEALIAAADGLYLFTKNWSDQQKCKIYRIPKTPGNYTVSVIDSIATPGLLTGANYHAADQRLLFVGYNFAEAFIIELSNVDLDNFSTATSRNWILPLDGSIKTEAIAYRDNRFAYLTKERNSLGEAVLYRLDTDFSTSTQELNRPVNFRVSPNPIGAGKVTFQLELPADFLYQTTPLLRLLDTQGRVVYQAHFPLIRDRVANLQLDVTDLASGVYFYEVIGRSLLASGKLLVN